MIKIALPTLFCLLLTGCYAYISGDLETGQLATEPLRTKISAIQVTNPADQNYLSKLPGIAIDESAAGLATDTYRLELTYDLDTDNQEKSSAANNALMATTFTFGLIPYYSKEKVNVRVKIYNSKTVVLDTVIQSYFEIYYGLLYALVPGLHEKPQPDSLSITEGGGVKGTVLQAIHNRLGYRLAKLLN